MRKMNFLMCIAALALCSSACNHDGNGGQNAGSHTIKGQLTGISAGTVKLESYNDDDRTSKVIDSIAFSKSSFELKGKLDHPQMMTLVVEPSHWTFQVFLENSIIRIKADTAGSTHFDYSRYKGEVGAVITNYTVSGSKSHDDYMKFQNDPENKRYKDTFAELNKIWAAEKDAGKKEQIRAHIDSLRTLSNTHQKEWISAFVSDDSRWNDWLKAMDSEKMPWIQVIDEFPVRRMPARIGTLYMIHFIHFYVLLDKEGRIILYTDNEVEIDKKLKELLG